MVLLYEAQASHDPVLPRHHGCNAIPHVHCLRSTGSRSEVLASATSRCKTPILAVQHHGWNAYVQAPTSNA